jgi:hypothetical protein
LLVQFQGMIAEYERAQILERSRRGKRHRAKQGEVSVLSGAPYGYRYVRKTEERAAYYEVIEAQAEVVRQVFDLYTAQALSIGAITRRLNELAVPTRKEQACWERSTIWAMLRNPAYRGMACFGKTQEAARQRRSSRALRRRAQPPRRGARTQHEAPRRKRVREGPMTLKHFVKAVGAVDDVTIAQIIGINATADELAEAQAWIVNDDPLLNAGRPLATRRVRELVDILAELEPDDDEDGRGAPAAADQG